MKNSLMWFRYDLRIKDNDALFEALNNKNCILVFILDNGYLKLETTGSERVPLEFADLFL